MTTTVTIAQLRSWRACDLDARIQALCSHLGREVGADEPVPLVVWADTPWEGREGARAEHSDKDLVWAAAHVDHRLVVAWAADCAEHVLRIYESRLPDDTRPRDCIAAVRAWLAAPGPRALEAVMVARDVARRAAAYAAYAAYAAADAADAAAAAAYAAAYAAAERVWQRARLLELLAVPRPWTPGGAA